MCGVRGLGQFSQGKPERNMALEINQSQFFWGKRLKEMLKYKSRFFLKLTQVRKSPNNHLIARQGFPKYLFQTGPNS